MTLLDLIKTEPDKNIIDGINRAVKNPECFEVEQICNEGDTTIIYVYGLKSKSKAQIRF